MAYAPCAKAPFQAKNEPNSYQHTQKNKRMDIVSVGTMSRCSKRRSHCSDSENNTFNERFENGGRTMIYFIFVVYAAECNGGCASFFIGSVACVAAGIAIGRNAEVHKHE